MKFLNFPPRATSAALICFLFLAFIGPSGAFPQVSEDGKAAADDLLPDGSKSDGCTLIADGPYKPCCVAHDREYFVGGTAKERRAADKRLYDCVRRTHGFASKLRAAFIWFGVRVGGVSFLPTPFRWGFGKKSKKPSSREVETSTTTESKPQFP